MGSGNGQQPRITVVTAARNAAATIGETLVSVRRQTYPHLEHIIVDGKSDDDTMAIVRRDAREGFQWLSEADAGIGDAMNKGIRLAHGEWILFLHADDYLLSADTITSVAPFLQDDADIVAFPILYGVPPDQLQEMRPRGATVWMNIKTGLNHQSTFVRRSLFQRLGPYSTDYRIGVDYEFFLRAYRAGARFKCVDKPAVAVMRSTGISGRTDWPSLAFRLSEERAIQRLHLASAPAWLKLFYAFYWVAYPAYRRLVAAVKR